MKIYYTLIFLIINISILYADFDTINVSNKVINFSSYCANEKITIFIMSVPGCKPCKILNEYLFNQNYDMKKIDIHYCIISSGIATKMWGNEGITAAPVVYFFAPSKNPVEIIHVEDKDYSKEIISSIISQLFVYLNEYQANLVDFNYQQLSTLTIENKQLQNEYYQLKTENDKLINQNDLLSEKIFTKSFIPSNISEESFFNRISILMDTINSLHEENLALYKEVSVLKQDTSYYKCQIEELQREQKDKVETMPIFFDTNGGGQIFKFIGFFFCFVVCCLLFQILFIAKWLLYLKHSMNTPTI